MVVGSTPSECVLIYTNYIMDIANTIQDRIYKSLLKLGIKGIEKTLIQVEETEDKDHGDYSSNIALRLSKELKQSPKDIAKEIIENLEKGEDIEKIEIAGPGFVNFFVSTSFLLNEAKKILDNPETYFQLDSKKGKKIVIEYTDPNPFKILHVGHLYTNIVGESFARLQEALGANVKRAIYQGDVGLHVAKTLWGLEKKLREENIDFNSLESWNLSERVKYLGDAYILGSHYYDELEDPQAKEYIDNLNYYISTLFVEELPKKDSSEYESENIKEKYLKGRDWCMQYFETIWKKLGTKFDYYFLESETSPVGYKLVKENIGKIFKEDDGAVIYQGDKEKGLHTRVFINKFGVPTYEAKDLGLAFKKKELIDYDESIIITGKEQAGYFKVVLDALGKINKDLADRTRHIPHGLIKSPDGKKMSSRKGTAGAEELISETTQKAKEMMISNSRGTGDIDERSEKIAIGAIKYAFLKVGVGKDIVFDSSQALSFDGDTGPYLMYTYARCNSLLKNNIDVTPELVSESVIMGNACVKELFSDTSRYASTMLTSGENYSPSILAQYLFDLGQDFNNFYQQINVTEASGDEKKTLLAMVKVVMLILKNGLKLLGITTVDEM